MHGCVHTVHVITVHVHTCCTLYFPSNDNRIIPASVEKLYTEDEVTAHCEM